MQGQELGFFGWLIKEAAPKKGGFFNKQTAVNSLILKKVSLGVAIMRIIILSKG